MTVPQPIHYDTTVDMVEINHFYDKNGILIFDQLIWYDWQNYDSRFVIRDFYCKPKNNDMPVKLHGLWVVYVFKTHNRYVIRAKHLRETWTQYDPELEARKTFAKTNRQKIFHR